VESLGDPTIVSLAMLAGLGAFHGLNPGMGWLFAVALGMQDGSRRAVWRALLPLALGHALAIAIVIAAARLLGLFAPAGWLPLAAGLALIALGVSRLARHRHPRWGGMRVGLAGLTMWSFLMASAHGAGLMALPLVLPASAGAAVASAAGAAPVASVAAAPAAQQAHVHAHSHAAMFGGAASAPGLLAATLAHGAGYLIVTALLAIIVYEKLGLGLLRRAWINVDLIWAVALLITGALTLARA
jgi:hypothetical protein